MRLGVAIASLRLAGGVSTYLRAVLPALVERGLSLGLFHESGPPPLHEIGLPRNTPSWFAEEIGPQRAVDALTAWRPDLVFVHGLQQPELEARVLRAAPAAVLFAHNYYGTCISGGKLFNYPVAMPCARRFGPACLLHYYPRRCGGLHPATMWRDYRVQAERNRLLHSYAAIVTNSEHMRREFLKHGLQGDRVVSCPLFASGGPEPRTGTDSPLDGARQLLFLGRMELAKGAHFLIRALPRVAANLGRPIHLTLAGDGRQREALEALASRLPDRDSRISIEFTGWVASDERDRLVGRSDLVVVPSLWPEPFGLVGLEAGLGGVPAVGFDVGGISEWLIDGFNGRLASGQPPTVRGLAETIVDCLSDDAVHRRLSAGARLQTLRLSLKAHVDRLVRVLADSASGSRPDARVERGRASVR